MPIKYNKHTIGYLFKRDDIPKITFSDILRELQSHLIEAKIIQFSFLKIQKKKFINFDSSVGDWKCQTRTSMIVDSMNTSHHHICDKKIKEIESLVDNLKKLLKKMISLSSGDRQKFGKENLQNSSFNQFLQKNYILYEPLQNIIFLSACFTTTFHNNILSTFKDYLSMNKFKNIINKSKSILCDLSINYEQELAKKYGTLNEQKLLNQIEIKNVQHMTSLFAGFKPIFKKMKALKQPFLTTTTFFCQCGGVQTNRNDFYKLKQNEYSKTKVPKDHDQVVTIVEVYQYPGSLADLQQKLNIEPKATDIPHEFRKSCTCKKPSKENPVKSFDEAIMAFFAQHPQFTNGAEINWQGLGLENSDLKKEYDYLRTLPGFSRENMSVFHINHMYASTIADVLKEQEEIEARLQVERK